MHQQRLFVYAHPTMHTFASRWGTVSEIDRDFFPNNMPNIMIHGITAITECPGGADVIYFSQYSDLQEKKIEEMIIFVLADTLNVRSLTVVDMYDPLATMERVTEEGRISTSNVDAHFWKTLPVLASGRKTNRVLYDQHTLQNRFYYTGGSTNVVLRSAIPLLIRHLESYEPCITTVAFPDDGACKRFSEYFKAAGFDTIVCGKRRLPGDKRKVVVMEGDPRDKHIIIVDDLVRSGGTLLECMRTLQSAGALNINAFVTHAEFPGDSWEKFQNPTMAHASLPLRLSHFFVTDSIPRVTDRLAGTHPFEVLSLSNDLAQYINIVSELR